MILKKDLPPPPLYTVSLNNEEYEFTYTNLKQAFQPIREGIQQVLQRIQHTARQNNWHIDQLIIVEGREERI